MGGSVELDAVVKFLRGRGRDDAAELVRARFASDRCAIARIPPDTLAVAASWAPRSDLLSLRCAWVGGCDAVRRAVPRHAECVYFQWKPDTGGNYESDTAYDPCAHLKAIEAIGQLFGPGCRRVRPCAKSPAALLTLKSFVLATNGGLEVLNLSSTAVSVDLLVELCSACPRLKTLSVALNNPLLTSAGAVEIAARVAPVCPMVSFVHLPPIAHLSPAESWAANFPNLETLDLDAAKGSEYCPSRFEAIEATMAACENIRDIDFGQCSVQRELLDFLARSPLGARLTRLSFADALIEDEMLVLAAQRFSHLRDLTMPAETEFDTELFSNLYLARPELTRLDFPSGHMLTDACFKHVCKTFSLHELAIGGPREELTRDFVDAILTSRCSLTLRRVEFDYFEFDVLESRTLGRLVSGCPALADVRWHYDERDKWSDDFIYEEEQDAIADVLASRGGTLAILAWNPKKPVIKPFRRYNYY